MNKRKKFMVPTSAFIVSCRPSSPPRADTPSGDLARGKADLGRNITSLAYWEPFVKLILRSQILVGTRIEYQLGKSPRRKLHRRGYRYPAIKLAGAARR